MLNKNLIIRFVVGLFLFGMAIAASGCDGSLGRLKYQYSIELEGMQYGTKDLVCHTAKGNVVGLTNSQSKESAKRTAGLSARANKMFR